MTKRRYPEAVKFAAALVLTACLWALPARAENVQPSPSLAAQTEASPAPTAQTEAPAAAETETENRAGAGPLGGVTTTTGGAALVGVGAYSFVRKQRQDERDRRRAEAETAEPVYFENHTRSGTLRPGEQNNDL